jgi:hypothetical protein
MKQIVIGLAGVKTSGKSTVTNIIRKHFELKEAALAEKLKAGSAQVFDVPRAHFDDQAFKEVPFADGPRILTEESIRGLLTFFKVNPDEFVDDVLYTKRIDTYKDIIGMKLESPRKIAQIVGTEVLRRVGEDIHCENLDFAVDGVTVVSDMRFPNEFAYLSRKQGIKFVPIYIKREAAESQVTEQSHVSETSVFKFCDKCFLVDNNGSLEETEAQVMAILAREIGNSPERYDRQAFLDKYEK